LHASLREVQLIQEGIPVNPYQDVHQCIPDAKYLLHEKAVNFRQKYKTQFLSSAYYFHQFNVLI